MARGLYAEVHHDETRFVSEGGGAKRAVGGNHNGKHTLKRRGIQHLRTFCVATVDFREGLHSICTIESCVATYLSLAVKSKQVHFDSNSLRHCLFNDNEASDMSQCDVVKYVCSSFVRIPYNSVITSFRQTFISHSFKCNSSYARLTLSYFSHPTDLTAC